ncbi:hypothetical protein [Micromonospora sp. IBHARD004]|uniref:hypothetical protein n=1 Tax=Micromonospora sp. IBHARD004 TaxID=3457764 RepID=UPI004058AA75
MASVDRLSLADRFEDAWRALESHLRQQWRQHAEHSGKAPDAAGLTAWARGQSILTSDQETFLDRCRGVRNAYAHVSFDDYSGPVAFPPRQVVERLEKILGGLRDPKAIEDVARRAVTCLPSTPMQEALRMMHRGDFSQLPYRHESGEWMLVTREQVGRWVEAYADNDGLALLDLAVPVSTLADDPKVGPVVPRRLAPSASLATALAEIEDALHRPDEADGGYPLVLVVGPGGKPSVRVLAVDDLPRAYRELGR